MWVNVCAGLVGAREFRNERRIYGLAGLDFSPPTLFRPSFKAARLLQTSSRESLSEVPAREVVLRAALPAARFVAADWMMHRYVYDASTFANRRHAVKSVNFVYLIIAKKMRDADASVD